MQTKTILLFFIVTLYLNLFTTSTALTLNCIREPKRIKINCLFMKTIKYSNEVGDIKRCEADSAISSTIPETSVTSLLYRNNMIENETKEIDGLYIDQADVKFIPTGIEVAIKKLKALSIMASGLLIVEKDNLQVFGENLVYVDFQKNQIRFLDANLFDSNTNLKVANFWDNSIGSIQADFFTIIKSLKQLQQLNLGSNKCINQIFQASKKDNESITIENFVWSHENCTNVTAVTVKDETEKSLYSLLCPDFHTTKAPPCDSVSACIEIIKNLTKSENDDLKKTNVQASTETSNA